MSILSILPDGCGYHYGFLPHDMRRIDVRRGPVDLLWRAYVEGERIGDAETGVFETRSTAEAAAVAWINENPPAVVAENKDG